jgi:DNA adenine methylase
MPVLPTLVNWYGGKQRLAREIISIMPEHKHYVEVFFGSGAVFFNKPKAPVNTINDLNANLVNVFIQARDHFEEFAEKIYWTLYSRDEYEKFEKMLAEHDLRNLSDLDRALAYLYLTKTNFGSRMHLGFSVGIEGSTASFNIGLVERLKKVREKLDGVHIENREFEFIVEKFNNNPDVLMYLDPPYWVTLEETDYYQNVERTFTEYHHEALASLLYKSKSKWILSYDNVPEIVRLYKDFPMMRIRANYSPGQKGKIKTVDELLITNYKAKKPQLDLLDSADIEVEVVDDLEKREIEVKLLHEKLAEPKEEQNAPIRRDSFDEQLGLFGK